MLQRGHCHPTCTNSVCGSFVDDYESVVCVWCEKICRVFTNHVAPLASEHVNKEAVAERRLHHFPKHVSGEHTQPKVNLVSQLNLFCSVLFRSVPFCSVLI